MVEGCQEPEGRRQQHAVAEHIAGHVADPDHGEGIGLGVHVHLAEVALDRLPGAPRGDAHALVVVALAPARREGVAEPVAALQRDGVRHVREGRGALVCRNHEVSVVGGIVPHGVLWRHDGAVNDVIGERQQRADEDPVALGALRQPSSAIGGWRQALGIEAALGTHRDDHRVLDLLRLHEAEDLGAEILRPIRPAQAPAGDVAEAQVHALDARRVDEDLEQRPGQRHSHDFRAGELETDRVARASFLSHLEEVRTQGRFDKVHEAAQDPILVEAGDTGQCSLDLRPHHSFGCHPVACSSRIEPGAKQGDEPLGDHRVPRERASDVVLPVADAELAQVPPERSQQRRLAPGQGGLKDKAVVAIGLGEPIGDCQHRLFEHRRLGEAYILTSGTLQEHVI